MLWLTLCVLHFFLHMQQSEVQRVRNEQIRRFIIQEIYTTEQTYLDHLNIIKKVSWGRLVIAF
jgi:hypothetical protein